MTALLVAALLGFAAGAIAAMFGVGGGVLFVPTLALVLGLSQLGAQATSLAAIIPVAALGAWLQHREGAVCWRPALVIGFASAFGVAGGALLADSLSEDVLRKLFAALLLVVAARLVWSGARS